MSSMALHVPVGTQFMFKQGCDVPGNLNGCWREALEKGDPQWAWIIGDDHTFEPRILTKLLDHGVDVVAPFCIKRKPPFSPLLFTARKEERYELAKWDEIPEKGLHTFAAVGSAGLLLSRTVMDQLGDPWFIHGPRYPSGTIGWDLYLCDRLTDLGFPIHADVSLTMGHTSPVTYTPALVDGTWGVNVDLGCEQTLHLK